MTLTKDNIKDIYALSPTQECMFFHWLYDKSSLNYFVQSCFRLRQELNISLVEKSLNELVKRYDILRTVFTQKIEDKILQVVLKKREIDFYFEDISKKEDKEAYFTLYKEMDRNRSFDLTRDALMRVSLFQLGKDDYEFIWDFHHIIMDGWCTGMLVSEFYAIYSNFLENRPYILPPVKPYRVYIDWLECQDKKVSRSFWRDYLSGFCEKTSIPRLNPPQSLENKYKNERAIFKINEENTAKLIHLAGHYNVTLNMVCQVIWGIILGKYNNTRDVVFGSVVSGRPPEIEDVEFMVGLFINTVPVRITFEKETNIINLVKKIRTRDIECKPHHYYPLVEIQNENVLKQNLVDHLFIFENYPFESFVKDVKFEFSEADGFEQAHYDFRVSFVPGDRLEIFLDYNANAYEEKIIENVAAHVIHVTDQILHDETKTVESLELLTAKEKEEICFKFNNTSVDYILDKAFPRLFAEQATAFPGRTAVVFKDTHLTYGELNRRADRLLQKLLALGIQRDEPVGILMDRSHLMAESILSVWKAGGAYIPLDIQYPWQRISGILNDSQAKVLISMERYLSSQLASDYQGQIIDALVFENPTEYPDSGQDVDMNSLAYVIYTSGSTGKPKGVMVEHAGMMNHLQAKIDALCLTGQSIVAQNASHTFDISVWQFFSSLLKGGKTMIYPKTLILDFKEFVTRIVRDDITILEVVPSYLSLLFDYLGNEQTLPLSLHYLLVTGEEVKPHLVRQWFAKYPGIKMVNAYGPTEASDDITHYIMERAPNRECIPIGKPLQNLKIYIVDYNMHLCPVGVKGEICVAGVGVGRGYLGDEKKTKQSFSEDPFSEMKGVRLYKTGDLGRWLPDGLIEFFGRKDYQVKIRGFRIELGEVENRLLNFRGVKEAVVINREERSGNKYLCAYIIGDRRDIIPDLKAYLQNELPGYMIPSYFVLLEKMPLTTNGKIDRKALPEPGKKTSEKKHIAHRNKVEEILGEIWSHVLDIHDPISIDDNFFELGGHSLRATVMISKINKALDVEMPLARVFKSPTIGGLAQFIIGSTEVKYAAIKPVEKKEYYPIAFAQKRLFILQQIEPTSIAYNMPQTVILEGELKIEKLVGAFKKILKRHDGLRTSFLMVGDTPVQRIDDQVPFQIHTDEQDYEDRIEKMISKFIRPFELSLSPLMRVGLIKVNSGTHILTVDTHHIIADGITNAVLLQDFASFYAGVKLPGIRIQYKDFSEWQMSKTERENLKKQEEYWLKRFQGEIPVLDFVTDYPRPRSQNFEGSFIRFQIEKNETDQLNTLALREGVTLFMVILSILNVVLSKMSNQEDILVGNPMAGRRHADLQGVIGMFVNTLVLRNQPQGRLTFVEFLKQVKEGTLEALENQDYPFEELVEHLAVPRDPSRNPLFDVMLVFQNFIDTYGTKRELANSLEGLKIKSLPYEHLNAKFDLTLNVVENERKLSLIFIYSSKLFKKETIEKLTCYFLQIVTAVIANPFVRIADMEIITQETRKEKLRQFHEKLREEPGIKPIQEKLAESFQKYKKNIAIEYDEYGELEVDRLTRLTYSDLAQKAAYISSWIAGNNIKKGSFIGIYIDNKIDIISTIIGILNRGCVFVPLDTSLPVSRIANMIRQVDIRIILTDDEHKMTLAGIKGENHHIKDIFAIDDSFYQSYEFANTQIPGITYDLKDKIYVYFTSGSTSTPNAIIGKNESLVQFLEWEKDTFSVDETYRMSQLAAVGFDAFLRNVFTPLLAGGTVCIPKRELVMDSVRLVDWIDSNRITFIHCVPSVFRIINQADLLRTRKFTFLKYIVMSGEQVDPKELKRWANIFGDRIQLVNCYGATETTLIKTFNFIRRGDSQLARIPVGHAMSGTRLILLDKYLKICGQGIIGEIYVRTAYSTYGYLNNPELTSQRFIENPFSKDPRDVIYKTGDLGREVSNGDIEILGRIDRQVKIRGVRIELESIENSLLKHVQIEKAILTNRNLGDGDNYLCAYILYKKQEPQQKESIPTPSELRAFLAKELPVYMIPSYFVQLDKIPLTPNGKIDQKALHALEVKTGRGNTSTIGYVEEKLAGIWASLLKIEKNKIAREDNFFELGGHSLKATIMAARIHKVLNIVVPLTEVFLNPTIEGLAQYIKRMVPERYVSINPVEKKDFYPLSSSQNRLYFIQRLSPEIIHYNIPQMVELVGILDFEQLEEAFNKLIDRHESLRTSFEMIDGWPVQRISASATFTLEYFNIENHEAIQGRNKDKDGIVKNFIRPFDLSKAPLIKVGIIKLEEMKHILMVDMHHIVTDGISINILSRDFMDLYARKNLPPLLLQYKDFSEWENDHTQKKHLIRQQEYWLKELSGVLPVLELPTDFSRDGKWKYEGRRYSFEIDEEKTQELRELAIQEGATMHILLLSIYIVLLAKLSDQEDIIVGMVVAGRRHADLEQIIGLFLNMLAIRNFPSREKNFREFLKEVIYRTLAAYDNQDYQFDDLVDKLKKNVNREMNQYPLFNVAFGLQNMDRTEIKMPGLKLVPYEFEHSTAKIDMLMMGAETAGKLSLVIEYNSGLFKEETIEQFNLFFQRIVSSVIENPDKKLGEIDVLPGEEMNGFLMEKKKNEAAVQIDFNI